MRSPEENLWAAVVLATVNDAVSLIESIAVSKSVGNSPSIWERDLNYLITQIESEWFYQVCDWAGIHRSYVLRLINEKIARLEH